MQADIRLRQPSFPGVCPLCHTPLRNTGATKSQSGIIMCPACGFSGPFVQRQQHLPSPAEQQPSLEEGPSVWIDPAVSAFLVNGRAGQLEYTQRIMPRSRHYPNKPPFVSSSHNKGPVTPIPPRASALHANTVKVRPKYPGSHAQFNQQQERDITRIPTYPHPTMWQYESPDFEIESSLSTLSLMVDAPTLPESSFTPRRTERLPYLDEVDTIPMRKECQLHIDEIDTNPLRLKLHQVGIDEIDTLPQLPRNGQDVRSLVSMPQPATMALTPASSNLPATYSVVSHIEQGRFALFQQLTDPSSWTAGSASGSSYARRIAERSKSARRRRLLNPIDSVRWWLLHPGRMEFILWLGGTILLLTVTFILLSVTAISLSWITPGQNGSISTLNNAGSNFASTPTSFAKGGLALSLLNTGPIEPGQAFHLRGQGFSPHGLVVFTDEKNHQMLIQDSQTTSVQADAHGAFTVTLNDTAWTSGRHTVVAHDIVSGHTFAIQVILDSGPFGKKATPTPVPGLTATATTTGGPGAFPTAVGLTPVPPKPTVGTTPPVPTPTRQPSPTATPAVTPTTGVTPTAGLQSSSSGGGNTITPPGVAASIGRSADVPHAGANLLSFWTWLLMLGYILALFLLGIAGVLHKRHNDTFVR
jgi:hypothetical protein